MYVKLALALTVTSAVISIINCEKSYDGRPYMQAYTRIKRGKYNSGPLRFYNRPPVSLPIKGVFSYTPPPNYMAEDDNIQYPGPPGFYSRPHKVSKPIDDDFNDNFDPSVSNYNTFSKRPSNEGLGDEDLNDIVKYLSKQDLNKIINLAGGKDSESERYPNYNIQNVFNGLQDLNAGNSDTGGDNTNIFKALVKEIDTDLKYNIVHQSPNLSFENNGPLPKLVTEPTPTEAYMRNSQVNFQDTAALEAEESKLKSQISYLKSQIRDGVVYTDSKMMAEESLPKPMNLREEQDYDVSYTNNVPTVVKAAQSQSYKLENFGDLPLMNNNHKLDTLSSYHVPHYTITSSSSLASASYGAKVPSVEPAPPASVAKAQSDAHLKAVKIWSHRSKGTAYTLHDDGTLSLEKPGRPPGGYGYP